MSGTINGCQNKAITNFREPIEVATHNVFRLEKHKRFRQEASDLLLWNQDGILNLPRVIDTADDFSTLVLDLAILLIQYSVGVSFFDHTPH